MFDIAAHEVQEMRIVTSNKREIIFFIIYLIKSKAFLKIHVFPVQIISQNMSNVNNKMGDCTNTQKNRRIEIPKNNSLQTTALFFVKNIYYNLFFLLMLHNFQKNIFIFLVIFSFFY
jgi:hypothetical protein